MTITGGDTSFDTGDRFAGARQIADAVLYEGYVLYPYRASAAKNQLRWQFGVIGPSGAAGSGATADPSSMQVECAIRARPSSTVQVRVRFLRVQSRIVEAGSPPDGFTPVSSLEVDDQLVSSWDEATEQELDLGPLCIADLSASPSQELVELDGHRVEEPLICSSSQMAGRVIRASWPIAARVTLAASSWDTEVDLYRLRVRVDNITPFARGDYKRDDILRQSLVATHILMAVDDGQFLSSIDPPELARELVNSCTNIGCFPVLVGQDERSDVMLASPIILYDNPEIAPESAGEYCDGTEIDEILALRILTLTDDEKREVRGTDARAARILDQCDLMPPEVFSRLHGAIRSLRPLESGPSQPTHPTQPIDPTHITDQTQPIEPMYTKEETVDNSVPWWDPESDAGFVPTADTILVGEAPVGRGSRVRLRPSRRADAQDIFLSGMSATVSGVFHDVDGEIYLAVVLEDDPAAELHEWYGRYMYFHPDEVEVLTEPAHKGCEARR